VFIGDKNFNQLHLEIARLELKLDAQDTELKIILPHSYKKFYKPVAHPQAFFLEGQKREKQNSNIGQLTLNVRNKPLSNAPEFADIIPIFQFDNWEIKFDRQGNFILEATRLPPARRIIINDDFTQGEVQGEFSEMGMTGGYPLQDIDMKLFVNWLSHFGDIILHASGVVADGKGYAFAGVAGVGKSTLASSLFETHSLVVLGEDQLILRYLEDRFWIFGTPWHENPSMCSPVGVPLEKLFFLDRDSRQGVRDLKPLAGVTRILQTAFIPFYRQDFLPGILDNLQNLSKQVPFYSLNYTLGTDPWPLIVKDS